MSSLKNSVVNETWFPWTCVTRAGLNPNAFSESWGSAKPTPPIELFTGPKPWSEAPWARAVPGSSATHTASTIVINPMRFITYLPLLQGRCAVKIQPEKSCATHPRMTTRAALLACEIGLQRVPVVIDPPLTVGIGLFRGDVAVHHADAGAPLDAFEPELDPRRAGTLRPLGGRPVLHDPAAPVQDAMHAGDIAVPGGEAAPDKIG